MRVEIETTIPLDVYCLLGDRAWGDMHGMSPYMAIMDSRKIWVGRDEKGQPLMVGGVWRDSFFGPATLWFMLCTPFYAHYVRWTRDAVQVLREVLSEFPVVRTYVDASFGRGQRFAEFFGFRLVDQVGDLLYYEVHANG